MSRILVVLCLLSCGLLFAPPGAASAQAVGASPVRILILGDSLTLGRHGMHTWRYRLDKEFHRQGVPFDFVGSLHQPYVDPEYGSASYADPNFDQDHYCKAGWWLRDAIATTELKDEVAKQHPDVVVLELGGADVVYGDSPETTIDRLRTAVGQIREAQPLGVRIILPEQLTKGWADPSVDQRVLDYNVLLKKTAAELSLDLLSPVTVAPTMDGFAPQGNLTMDSSHLSPTGEAFYAQRVAEEMHDVGILPNAPDIYHGYIPWTRTVPLSVKPSMQHITASWSMQTVSSAHVRWRQAGTTAWHTRALQRPGTTTWAVPGGHAYEVQLQITWYKLTGPWGPSSRVTVPAPPRPAAPARVTVTRTAVRWTAAARATSYVVEYRTAQARHWSTRRTTKTRLALRDVSQVRVQAVGAGGRSPWRAARRA